MALAAAFAAMPATAAPPALRLERALGDGRAPAVEARDVPLFARAQRIEGELEERIVLEGRAEVRSAGSVLRAERIVYARADELLQARGEVRLFRDGVLLTGPELDWQVDAETGRMPNANFSFAPRRAHGSAALVEILAPGRARLTDARYSNCSPQEPAWWVKAERIDLDQEESVGVARSGRLVFYDVPILAAPYLQFPLGDERRSGLLTPSFGVNTRLGLEVTVPIYWNIAPSHDATIAPRLMSKRGVLLQNEFRYLRPTWRGRIQYDVLPEDSDTGTRRDLTSLQHEWAGPGGLSAGWNYNRVSDDLYFADFGANVIAASQSILLQEGHLGLARPFYSTALRVTRNQTLIDPLAPVVKPYERIPQLTFSALHTNWHGFDLRLHSEAVHFEHPRLESGRRYLVNPSVAYPWLAPGWFVIPRVQLHATRYQLEPGSAALEHERRRTLPIASLDAGLVFERDGRWLGEAVTQTLEPRLYYAYIPHREQNTLPNFDSALADFNFAQLFSENVFVGADRIGEANQWTAALVGRWLDPATGAERMRAAVGQRFYLAPQRVTLPGGVGRTEASSDALFALSGRLARAWLVDVALQHSNTLDRLVRSTFHVRYQPRPASVVSLAHRYKIDDLDQLDLAAQWPLSRRWFGVGRVNYSLRDRQWVEALAGFEYRHDCWLVRFAAQRFRTTAETVTTQFFFALELDGIGRVGAGSRDLLRRNIPGYQVINPPAEQPGRFEVYE
jgi:LPS-assembly protein